MRVVVTGATGNVGTSLVPALIRDDGVESILGLARRTPTLDLPKTAWVGADVSTDDLVPHFTGADCVVHLAWLIQPSRDERTLARTNVLGSERVFQAAAEAGVGSIVYASSVGAYSPGPKDRLIDETWPTGGIPTSFYSRHKSKNEAYLDRFEAEHPDIRIVRLRPGLIFKREAATGVRRLFIGPLFPNALLRRSLIPAVPNIKDLVFQAVHSNDVAEAYRLAISSPEAHGPYNVVADPIITPEELAALLHARLFKMSGRVVRALVALSWRLRLQPTPEGWVDMALNAPLLDPSRASEELGWKPRSSAGEALMDLLDGLRDGATFETPPLSAEASGPLRVREFATGIGKRTGLVRR